jgi:hypothetical protein
MPETMLTTIKGDNGTSSDVKVGHHDDGALMFKQGEDLVYLTSDQVNGLRALLRVVTIGGRRDA